MADVVCRLGPLFGVADCALALARGFEAIVLRGKGISFFDDERLIYKEQRGVTSAGILNL